MEAARTHAPLALGQGDGRSRLGRLASDERLVARARSGSEEAFAVLYERHYRQILSFCRHMLGSLEESEDAVQQTFINAYRAMLRSEKELKFRPWLYRIARNQCISALRARRYEVELGDGEPSLAGLSDEVAGRDELRNLLVDLAGLPTEQREALLLTELHDNSHADVAEILGCDREKVKSLVFQARSSLMKSREARDTSCEEIRRQISVLRGGALRRNVIRRHLKGCEGCRAFSREVKRQRRAMAVLLPVFPSPALKLGAANLVAASGVKAGSAISAGAGAAAVAQAPATGGALSAPLSSLAAKLGLPALLVKGAAATVAVTVVAAGGTVAVKEATRTATPGNDSPAGVQPALPGTTIPGPGDLESRARGRSGSSERGLSSDRASGRARGGGQRGSRRANAGGPARGSSRLEHGAKAHAGRGGAARAQRTKHARTTPRPERSRNRVVSPGSGRRTPVHPQPRVREPVIPLDAPQDIGPTLP